MKLRVQRRPDGVDDDIKRLLNHSDGFLQYVTRGSLLERSGNDIYDNNNIQLRLKDVPEK